MTFAYLQKVSLQNKKSLVPIFWSGMQEQNDTLYTSLHKYHNHMCTNSAKNHVINVSAAINGSGENYLRNLSCLCSLM